MTFNAASRPRSLEDRSAALGSSRCELPVMHSVPKSAVLPYASGVGDLSRRLLNKLHQNSKPNINLNMNTAYMNTTQCQKTCSYINSIYTTTVLQIQI